MPRSRSGASRSAAASRSWASSRSTPRTTSCTRSSACWGSLPRWRRRGKRAAPPRALLRPDPVGQGTQAALGLLASATAELEHDERSRRGAAGADREDRADPVTRVAQRPQLALGQLLRPARELLRRGLSHGRERVLDAAREAFGRVDRTQGVTEQALNVPAGALTRGHGPSPPAAA